MNNNFFEKNAIWKGLAVVVGVDTLFAFLGFDKDELAIVTFFTAIVLHIIYVDERIKKIEDTIKKFNNDEGDPIRYE